MDYMKHKWIGELWSGVAYDSSLDMLGTVEWIPISCDQWYLSPLVADVSHEVVACRGPIPNDPLKSYEF
jgi:hypothetical protein